MKFKKLISALIVLTMVAGTVPVMGAPASVTFESVTTQAADSTAVDDFLGSAFLIENVDICTNDAFNMNGRIYYEGVILKGHYGNENWCTASFNVENIDTLSFTLGHVDNENGDDGILNIYIDNNFYDTVELNKYMNLMDMKIDVSNASVIRFNVCNPGSYKEGTYAISNIKVDDTLGKDFFTPKYSNIESFITQAYTTEQIDIRTSDDKRNAFNMNGRTYYEGVILKGHYGNENWCTISFNVESIDTLSFTLGHVDNENGDDGILNIYIDNKFYDTVELNKYMNLMDMKIDVSNASVIRFNVCNPGSYKEGTYAISNIKVDDIVGKDFFTPEYSDIESFITQAYTTEQIDIRTSEDKRSTFSMNGRTYYEGVILKGHYGNENWCTASFNVENIGTLSFTLGHVDNENGDDGILNIYIDNKFYDTVELNAYMNLKDMKINVSKASVIRFNVYNPGSYKEGTYGIADISITEKQDNTGTDTDSSLGDIDFDGKITASDATFVLQVYTNIGSGQGNGMSDAQYKAADVDGDGVISGSDATLILRYYTMISSIINGSTPPTMEEWIKIELN